MRAGHPGRGNALSAPEPATNRNLADGLSPILTNPQPLASSRTSAKEASVNVKIIPNNSSSPIGKLADAELHFTDGPLDGLKLIGFGVWERRGGGRNVTFPARQYSVNGERRSFALLRPIIDIEAQERIRDLVLEAYAEFEASSATKVL